ncbi:MAG: hypothetical protein QOF36_1190 [Microbacteriaceae bacterium]|nr:hypothetical protein [Microbacteriaceae bacterium]
MKLHEIDITDKHRYSISSVAGIQDLSRINMVIKGDSHDIAAAPEDSVPLTTGSVHMKVTSQKAFDLVRYTSTPLVARFDVPLNGGVVSLLEILGTMAGTDAFA